MGIIRIAQRRVDVNVARWHDSCGGPDDGIGVMTLVRVRVRGRAGAGACEDLAKDSLLRLRLVPLRLGLGLWGLGSVLVG